MWNRFSFLWTATCRLCYSLGSSSFSRLATSSSPPSASSTRTEGDFNLSTRLGFAARHIMNDALLKYPRYIADDTTYISLPLFPAASEKKTPVGAKDAQFRGDNPLPTRGIAEFENEEGEEMDVKKST
ncbi:hypothetical protein PG995_005242 [Apiospora arundinis]